MDFTTQLILKAAVGAYLLIVSSSVLFALKRDPAGLRYALIIFGAALWVSLNALNEYLVFAGAARGWLASCGGLTSIATCFFIFDYALNYPEPDAFLKRLRIPAIIVAGIAAAAVFHPDWIIERRIDQSGELVARFGWPYALSSGVCVLLAAGAAPVFWWRLRRIQDRRHRRQILSFLGGAGVAIFCGALFVFILPIFGISRFYFLGVLSVWFFAYYSLMSVYRSGVIDFRRELRESARFILLYAGVFVPVTVLLWWLFSLYSGESRPAVLVFGLLANALALRLAAFFQQRVGWSVVAASPLRPEIVALKRRITSRPLTLRAFRNLAREALDLDQLTFVLREVDGRVRTIPRSDAALIPDELSWPAPEETIALDREDESPHGRLHTAGYDVILPLELSADLNCQVLAGTVESLRAMRPREVGNLQYLLEVFGSHRRLERWERRWRGREREARRAKVAHVPQSPSPDPHDPLAMTAHLFSSPAMAPLMKNAAKYARMSDGVLITGETGAGKGVMARYLHDLSDNSENEMITLDCAAMPAELVESELFGHVKGAFTGATRDHAGVFERARGTNLFLDEIGELSPELQVKLLRVLQERTFYRVGGDKIQKTDARFFFATNRDLAARVAAGEFRADLYYRIRVMHLDLPPLRDRQSEIPILAEHYLREFLEREGLEPLSFSLASMDRLETHAWPGNLRELRHTIHRAAVHASGNAAMITPEHLELPEARSVPVPIDPSDFVAAAEPRILNTGYKEFVSGLEREILGRFYRQLDGNQTTMARRLGLERNFMRRKLIDLGIIKKSEKSSGK